MTVHFVIVNDVLIMIYSMYACRYGYVCTHHVRTCIRIYVFNTQFMQ